MNSDATELARVRKVEAFKDEVRTNTGKGQRIAVGILASLRGTMSANETGVALATLLAIKEINDESLLTLGKIVPDLRDGNSNATTFEYEAESLLNTGMIDALFGCWTSASRKSVRQVIEESRHDSLLFYPVQFEGLEESEKIIYTGSLPNQQIYPVLKWRAKRPEQNGRPMKCLLIGSDYIYPRVAAVLVNHRLAEFKHPIFEPCFIPFFQEGKNAKSVQDAVTIAVTIIEREQPDVVLNFINGDANFVLLNKRSNEAADLKRIPMISFSLTPADLLNIEPGWIGSEDYVSVGYLEPDDPQPGSFAYRFKLQFGADEITTDAMWNAYAGVYLWVSAANLAESTDASSVRAALKEVPPVKLHSDHLRIDASGCPLCAYKIPKIARIVSKDGRLVFKSVDEFGVTESIPPRPYPEYGARKDWNEYSQRQWFTSDVIPTVPFRGREHIQKLLQKEEVLAAPTPRKIEFVDLMKGDRSPYILEQLVSCQKLTHGEHHNLEDLPTRVLRTDRPITSKLEELLRTILKFGCTDEDVSEAFKLGCGTIDAIKKFAKAKAFCYRTDRMYLFDLLDYARAKLQHSVFLNDIPVTSIGQLTSLFHDDLKWRLTPDWNWRLFASLVWVRGTGANAVRSLTHRVWTIAGSKKLPSAVKYSLVARGTKISPALYDQLFARDGESLPDGGKGDTRRLFASMRRMFGRKHTGVGPVMVVDEPFLEDEWIGKIAPADHNVWPDYDLRIHNWANNMAQEAASSHTLVIAGCKTWKGLQWP